MIEIFKTNGYTQEEAAMIISALKINFPDLIMNFDLLDCDNILRIKGENLIPCEICKELQLLGYSCELLQ